MNIRKIFSAIILLAMCSAALCSCADKSGFSDSENLSKGYARNADPSVSFNYLDGASEPPAAYNTFIDLIINYELKLLRSQAALNESGKSFAFSPANTTLQLALLANGASDDTRQEIMLALGSSLGLDNLNVCASYFKSRLLSVSRMSSEKKSEKSEEKQPEEYVKLSGTLFLNDDSDIKSAFLRTNADYYDDSVFRFSFKNENAAGKINAYFSDFTANAGLDKLSKNGKMVSASASAVADNWLSTVKAISEDEFKNSDGTTEKLSFFTSDEMYMSTELAEGIIKYTEKNPLKLLLIKPKNGMSLNEYIRELSSNEYMNLLESVDVTKTKTVKIPSFTIKSSSTAEDISQLIEKSGIRSLFTDSASFSAMSHTEALTLDAMYEIKPSITVSAAGISAEATAGAADSAVKASQLSAKNEASYAAEAELSFDSQFIFMLIDNESNIPVFAGIVDSAGN